MEFWGVRGSVCFALRMQLMIPFWRYFAFAMLATGVCTSSVELQFINT